MNYGISREKKRQPSKYMNSIIDNNMSGVYRYTPDAPYSFEKIQTESSVSTGKKNASTQTDTMDLLYQYAQDESTSDCVDINCYEKAEDIFEDLSMEDELLNLSIFCRQDTSINTVNNYPTFQYWGTEKSPFVDLLNYFHTSRG